MRYYRRAVTANRQAFKGLSSAGGAGTGADSQSRCAGSGRADSGTGPKQIIETRELIRGLAGQHTVVLSTHILPEVSKTCERVVVINGGKVVAVGAPDELTHRLQGFESILVTAEGPRDEMKSRLERVEGVTLVEEREVFDGRATFEVHAAKERDVRSELARAVVESQWRLLELRTSGMSLEDIFLKLTTRDMSEEEAAETTNPEGTKAEAKDS